MKAEQWTIVMENLLKAARIPKENQVEVVYIQLTNVARTWWLAEEIKYHEPLTWEKFMEAFHTRIFPIETGNEEEVFGVATKRSNCGCICC